jgi:hypothetical protein
MQENFTIFALVSSSLDWIPLGVEVLSRLLTAKANQHGRHVNPEYECTVELVLHWIYSNVYPISVASAKRKVEEIFQSYRKLKKFSNKSGGYWLVFNELSSKLHTLFDIRANKQYTKIQE